MTWGGQLARLHSTLLFLKQANHRRRSRSQSRDTGKSACQTVAPPGLPPSFLASTPIANSLPSDRDSVGDALGGGLNENVPSELVPRVL